jgi:hypothetical protein
MARLITFENGLDSRTWCQITAPAVARFNIGRGVYRFIVIGTLYGYIHTSGGDVRTWRSYSGARRAAKNYDSGIV